MSMCVKCLARHDTFCTHTTQHNFSATPLSLSDHISSYIILSESDDFDEEVIYSQESPKLEEFFRDFDWELDRFVEYRSPFTRKETLPIKKTL